MIRGLVLLIGLLLVYYAIRTVVRSAVRAYRDERAGGRRQAMGDALVLDPQCRTYIVRDRAVMRNVRGSRTYFCSEDCAKSYEAKSRA